jgi:predicted DNA-binding protein (MmcQ/YjbR family)
MYRGAAQHEIKLPEGEPVPAISKIAADLRKYALSFPEAWEDFPWEHQVVKVRKKIFVFIDNNGNKELRITAKLLESGDEALEMENCEMTGYGLGKAGWISAWFTPTDEIDVKRLKAWIDESYRAVAPKTLVKKL